ncbi:MAG: dihydropyrimidinase, partial [Pseudomonadota bacterium]
NKTINAANQHSALDVNIFEGWNVTGLPVVTISQGKVVYRDGTLTAERGVGRYIDRPPFATVFEAQKKVNKINEPKAVRRKPAVHVVP